MTLPKTLNDREYQKFEYTTGTRVKTSTRFSDGAVIDAFGRLRVSNPVTLFDSKNIFDDPDIASTLENASLFFDNQETDGSGTSTTYNANKSEQVLTVGNETAGTRIRQTKMRFNYQPGKSLLAILSFNLHGLVDGITKREGYFDDNNGLFIELSDKAYIVQRSKGTGSVVDTKVEQDDWNIDKMDGTGKSKITLDFEKTQILFIDFEWLGVGRVRFGFVVDGLVYYVHEFNNANSLAFAYMGTPNLPIRSEISNDGTGAEASITQICSTVISEGGSQNLGVVRSVSTAGTNLDANTENSLYALLGLKLKDNYLGASVEILNVALQLQTASHRCEWVLILNPTVAGTFTYSGVSQSALSVAKGATANTVTGGYEISGGFIESAGNAGGAAGSGYKGIQSALKLGSTIAGVSDTLVLCVRPIGGSTNVDVEGAINWRELV